MGHYPSGCVAGLHPHVARRGRRGRGGLDAEGTREIDIAAARAEIEGVVFDEGRVVTEVERGGSDYVFT